MKRPHPPVAMFATALSVGAGLDLCVPPAHSTDQAELAEVLVTVQRRPERLQSAPIAATVLTGDQLERAQVANVDQLQYAVPNLTNSPANVTRNALNLGLRGLAPRDNRPTVDPTVGIYLDDVYLGRMLGVNPATLDLERIEVLRGPQGTLYGRNTIGGAVNLISRKPGAVPEARMKLSFGNYQHAGIDAMMNLPWSDGWQALRLSTSLRDRRGFARTVDGADLDDERLRFVRLQYRLAPATPWELNVAADFSDTASGAQRRTLYAVAPGAASLPAALGNPGDTLLRYLDPDARLLPVNVTGAVHARAGGISAVLTADTGRVAYKSISSYRWIESSALNADTDATPYDISSIGYRIDDQHQLSQELQALGTALDGRLAFIGGLHHFRESGRFRQRVRSYVSGISNWNESLPYGDTRNRATALYAQADFMPLPRWKLTAGARYNREGRQLTSQTASINSGVLACRLSLSVRDDPTKCRATLPERTFSFVPWTTSIAFEPDEGALYYLKYSHGFRSGGYNINGTGLQDLTTFEPESVMTWEAGIKRRWSDRRVQLHLALFRSSFDDIQVSERDLNNAGALGVAIIRNGGRAKIDGAELEMTALLGPVRAAAALGRTRAAFTRLDPRVQEVALNSKFLQSPEHTASIRVDAPWRTPFGEVELHLDYGWRSTAWFEHPPESTARQSAFGLLNAQLSALPADRPWGLSFWVRNLADQRYWVRASEGTSISTAIPGDPRTYGLTVHYTWRPRAASE